MSAQAYANPNDLVHEILVAVTAMPETMAWRANTGVAVTASRNVVRFNLPGTPDILGVQRRSAFAIEAKTGSGVLSTVQKNWRKNWLNAGGIYILARSVDDAITGLSA